MKASWLFHNSNINRFCHMITHVQTMIFSQSQSMNQKPYWALTIIISVIEAIAIYHNIGKSLCQSLKASPHTQPSFSLSQLLTVTRYLWLWSFSRTQRKIGAYSFAPQPFTSRVMSTIIIHASLYPIRYIYIYIMFFPTCWACQRIKWKRKGEDHRDSCIR